MDGETLEKSKILFSLARSDRFLADSTTQAAKSTQRLTASRFIEN